MKDNIEFRFVSWNELEYYCDKIYTQMLRDNYKPDCIIALLRGGVVPARIFSDHFNILLDFFALDVKMYDGINQRMEKAKIKAFDGDVRGKCLIADDIMDSGRTMEAVLEYLKGKDVTTATVFWKENSKTKPDYYAEIAKENEWIVFPFEVAEFNREKIHGSSEI
jgi:hypoxanthine phosphoribosyltransferase